MPKPLARRAVTALIGAVGLSLAAAGCVSIPSGGPVLSYPVSQSGNGQNPNLNQIAPPPPAPNETPTMVVSGFLAAGASFAGQQHVAREYLTTAASGAWNPGWSATVFKGSSPTVTGTVPGPKQKTASVTVSGSVLATLSGGEAYAFPSATTTTKTFHFDLVKDGTQWRISSAPPDQLLLTSTEFTADYQLLNLYFFDPTGGHLVPDPVYVPLEATEGDLLNKLVQSLIKPPGDWIGGATISKIPSDTTLRAVTLEGGIASVNLVGKTVSKASASDTAASDTLKEQISAQLYWTLKGVGQGQQQQVKSIVLLINGKPFVPGGKPPPDNSVQNQPNQFEPAEGPQQAGFFYLNPAGQLMWHKEPTTHPVTIATIGRGYTSLAVSPAGEYLAAVHDGTLYTGKVGATHLTPRDVDGGIVTSLSWDRNNYLWVVASSTIYRLPAIPAVPGGPPPTVTVNFQASCNSNPDDKTALRVAPDGVRVAIVFGGQQETLAFGAIIPGPDVSGPGQQPQSQVGVSLSPFFVCGPNQAFKALSWYGADDVVALSEPDDTVTDYPVNGGTSTQVHGPSGSTSITASVSGGLILSQAKQVSIAQSLSGVWSSLLGATSPAFPG
jgi:hypothetical protein